MHSGVLTIAITRLALQLGKGGRFAARFLVLAVALVSYGSVPSTAAAQSEVESQLQEEIASGSSHCDLRTRLRGASQRRAGVASIVAGPISRTPAMAGRLADLGPRVSLGLKLPLRC